MFKNIFPKINRNAFIKNKITKKCFSQVYDKIVKLSEDVNSNELKFPFYETNYSIYFKKEETLKDLLKKFEGIDQKLQTVECLDTSNEIVNENKPVRELIRQPFQLKINKHITVKYFPSINLLISTPGEIDERQKFLIFNNYNYFLYQNFNSQRSKEFKTQIENELTKLLSIYEKYYKLYEKSEELLNKKLNSQRKLFINSGILFFILNLIIFYVLIYHIYGWDTIEPITYIVGNIYWIMGLAFFVFKKKKLEFSFFYSDSFTSNFMKNKGQLLGFSRIEKDFIAKEIKEIKRFKEALTKF
jgi:hypothetical protein